MAVGIEFVDFPTLPNFDVHSNRSRKIRARNWCIESMRSAAPRYPAVAMAIARIRFAPRRLKSRARGMIWTEVATSEYMSVILAPGL